VVQIFYSTAGDCQPLGEFPPWPAVVTLPAVIFAGRAGTSFTVSFCVFDGVQAAANESIVTFQMNRPLVIPVTANWSLPLPAAGPAGPVTITVQRNDTRFGGSLWYRFDSSADWTSTGLSTSLIIQPSEFTQHLRWNRVHCIEFRASDSLEEGSARLEYRVLAPAGTSSPHISIVAAPLRFGQFRPSWSQRTFSVTVADPGGGPDLVDFSIDVGAWSDLAELRTLGTQHRTVPAEAFAATFRPGPHNITFRASGGPASTSAATVQYVVNSPPTLALVSATAEHSMALSVADADGDPLVVMFSIDARAVWFEAPGGRSPVVRLR
jgi:hypothetical protein